MTETRPFAVWQAPDGLKLIGKDGAVLADYDGNRRGLPLIVGPGANSAAAAMLSLMQRYPEISAQTRALVRVGERRWDLELGNGAGSVVVMLPEKGYPEEVARLAELIARQGLLDRDVTRIDMRMADRMVIRMSEEGGELVRARRADQIKHLTSARRERNT